MESLVRKTEKLLLLTATLEQLGMESYFVCMRLLNTELLPELPFIWSNLPVDERLRLCRRRWTAGNRSQRRSGLAA